MIDHPGNDRATIRTSWLSNRDRSFLLLNVAFVIVFAMPLWSLMVTSWNSSFYTYIPFIPFISAYLIFENRQTIFSGTERSYATGLIFICSGLLILFMTKNGSALFGYHDHPALVALSLIVIWIGGFMLCYGIKAARRASFPLLFLLLAVPIPDAALERIIVFLQKASAEISYVLLQATGTPVARDGITFHLPKLDIEIAKECSGIRSSLSLAITGLLASYFFLRTTWARAILLLSIVPIAIIKNGIRITVLSVLGVYWDERILAGDLHRKGGIVFFLLALLLLGAVIIVLKKMERRFTSKGHTENAQGHIS